MLARALPMQGVDAPAAAEPVPDAGTIEGVEHRQHVLGTHSLQGCHRRKQRTPVGGFGPEAPVLGSPTRQKRMFALRAAKRSTVAPFAAV